MAIIITKRPTVNSIQCLAQNIFNGELNHNSIESARGKQDDALKNNISTDVIHLPSSVDYNNQFPASTVPVSAYVDPSLIMAAPSVGSENGAAKASASDPNNSFELNWSDPEELLRHQHLLDQSQQRLLALITKKRVIESKRFDHRYFSNAYPIIAANPKFAERYICCGRPQMGGILVRCDKYQWCSHCATYRSHRSLETYLPAFHKGTFHFLTVSFKGGIPFDAANSARMLLYWDAIDAVLTRMQKEDFWSGLYWVNEIAILSFLPIMLLPHAHAIVHADSITDEHIAYLNALLTDYTGGDDCEITLTPSILSRQIKNESDFNRSICYLTKAIDLASPYTSAWIAAEENDRSLIPSLNRQMREVLEGLPVITGGRERVHRIGSMSARCKSFIGVKPKDRETFNSSNITYRNEAEEKMFLKADTEVLQDN